MNISIFAPAGNMEESQGTDVGESGITYGGNLRYARSQKAMYYGTCGY